MFLVCGRFVSGYLDAHQAGWVREEAVEVLHLIRPMAVSLVDAWWVPLALLHSQLVSCTV